MNILVLENEPSSRRGGQELSLLDVCQGLAERGHGIHLIYNADGDLLDKYGKFCKSIAKVRCYTIDRHATLSSLRDWILSLLRALKVPADVVYVNQYHDTLLGGMLARLKSVPLVCHLRLFPPGTFCGQWRIGLRAVTSFIANSQATRASYLEAGFAPETIDVVYNGIDLDRFSIRKDRETTRQLLGISPETYVILYAGRIDRHKNIEFLLRSFPGLGLMKEEACLLIAGGPLVHASPEEGLRYVDELKSLCHSLSIGESVRWLGRRSDLPELFRAADVTVLPSKMPETFGRTIAESMACGTPALGVRLGGLPEVLSGEFSDYRVEDNDVADLTALLKSLRDWRVRDPMLALRCRSSVEARFTAERMVTGVEQVLKKAVELGPERRGPAEKTLAAWGRE